MIKVLLVEDELPSLRSLKQKLLDLETEVEIVGEAFNGKIALDMIGHTEPDVVITDIKMPIMDGIQLIRILREKYPAILPVIVSGFQEFEYARQAMKLNVEEYLSKPVAFVELAKTIEVCKSKLQSAGYMRELHEIQQSLLHQNPELKINFDTNFQYHLINACIGNQLQLGANFSVSSLFEYDPAFLQKSISENLLHNVNLWFFDGSFPNEKIIVIKSPRTYTTTLIHRISKEILDYLITVAPCPVNVFVSQPLKDISNLRPVMIHQRTELAESMILGTSQCFYASSPVPCKNHKQFLTNETNNRLLMLAQQQQYNMLRSELKKLFLAWETHNCTLFIIEKELLYLINSLQKSLFASPATNDLEKYVSLENVIFISHSFEQLFINFWSYLENLLSENQESKLKRKNTEEMVSFVETYMENNVSKQISLQALAELSGISQVYLCRIFKKHKNMSPIDFFIKMKIKRAKEYIQIFPNMLFKDIAESFGYDNSHYFSKLFKEIEGISPSEYRNQIHSKAHSNK